MTKTTNNSPGRRGNREGTIFQRPNGSWTAEIRWTDRFGRSQRSTRTAKTRAEASRLLKTMRTAAEADQPAGERLTTVEQYWERWRVGSLRSNDRKPATVELYSGAMRNHVLPALGGVRLARLTAGQVEEMLVGMLRLRDSRHGKAGEPVSGVARRSAYTVLSLMLATAVRDGAVTRNVCDDVDRPKVDTPEAEYLSPAQLRQVLDALDGHRLQPLVLLLATTGMRIGEALALRWSDIDAETKRVKITGTVRVIGGASARTAPKSLRGRRTLPLSRDVVDSLRAWRKVQAAERLRAGTTWPKSEHEWVFTTASGALLDHRNASRSYARALKAAGLKEIPARFHIIRHSVASAMLGDGAVSLRTASDVLGHATTGITADTYGHVAQQSRIDALAVVMNALGDESASSA